MRVETRQPAAALDQAASVKLRKHATEFEGMLLNELMGKMQHTFSQTEGGTESGDAGSESIASLGTQALSRALAERNVLGLGAMVVRSLSGTTTPVTSSGLHLKAVPADVVAGEKK